MAIKTTIRITKGTLSYTLWTIDGVIYGPTNPQVPNQGLATPSDHFVVAVEGQAPQYDPPSVALTMAPNYAIVCQWNAPKPGEFLWTLNGHPITAAQRFVRVAGPAEFFVELVTVNGERPTGSVKDGCSVVDITHTVV
jgi:hypothetical protein